VDHQKPKPASLRITSGGLKVFTDCRLIQVAR